jgi:peptidyl-prolyl cis-trans isomerase SurA
MFIRVVVPVSALLLLATLSACNRKQSSGDVVARVNGKAILRSEVDKYYNNQVAGTPQKPTGEAATSLRLNILRELIDNEIMMQRAEKLGLLATDAEVDNKLTEIKAPYTAEEFDRRIKDKNLTVQDFKLDLRRNLTVQKVLNKEVTSKISISDADISAYYNEHKAEFNLIEPQYHLAQILITAQPNPQVRNLKNSKAQNEADARAKAQMVMNRLESGEDFASVAMNYSEDAQTANNGGDMGFAPESSLKSMAAQEPSTRDAILRLKPGETSGILPVSAGRQVLGYRIVKLVGKEPAGQRDLNDPRVQQAIREQLRDRREQLLKAAYYETVRDEARVENYLAQEILKSVK